ncbi:MAG: choice-of-anchor Q domain-containing protein [Pyrinomonadaceae bacterium]
MFCKLFSNRVFSVCVLSLFGLLSVQAATFTVTRTDDRNMTCSSNVDCSLREAVNAANTLAGNDTIDFDAAVGTVQLAATLPSITTTININGGAGVTVSGDAANFTFRAFLVPSGGNLSLNNLTVNNAKDILGGGLHNQTGGMVSMTNCNFSGNSTTVTAGGGIFNDGMMTLTNTVVIANTAANQGGGIFNGINGVLTLNESTVSFNGDNGIGGGGIGNAGTLTVNRSTIYGNLTQGNGGGIFNNSATLNLTNSTVSFNSAFANNGGGVFNFGTSNIVNSTITDQNTAVQGGGIFNFGGSGVNLRNTIVAGNSSPNSPDVSGVFVTPMFNLIGKSDGSFSFTNGMNGNIVGTIAMPVDPLLLPIANNGGATQTYALMSGASPAANTGSNALAVDPTTLLPLATDQRGTGFPRIIGGRVDIGAFESPFAPSAANVSVSGRVLTSAGRGIARARVLISDINGVSRSTLTSSFGYYRFENIEIGQTYQMSVLAKGFSFDSLILTLKDELSDYDFIALPQKPGLFMIR